MKRFRALFAVVILCLLAIGVYVFFNLEQLGLILPSLQELEHRANVAAGQLGDKSVPKWRDFLARSRKFAEENPDILEIWLLRGAAALVVGDQEAGKEAGEHIVILNKSADPTAAKLIKVLWAKRWVPTSQLNWDDTIAIFNDVVKGDTSPSRQYYEIKIINTFYLDFKGTDGSLPDLRVAFNEILEIKGDDTAITTPPYYLLITGRVNIGTHWVENHQIEIALNHRVTTQLAAELLAHLKDLARAR
jgi:hypothetical protein